ncbi:MAG: hypothetical protein ABW060_14535 [Solirubrobacteraceae bacterium]
MRTLALFLFVALALPAGAAAGTRQVSLIQDDLQLLQSGDAVRERGLDDVQRLGADGVRAVVLWRDVAPRKRPRGFDATDPAAYRARRWDALDGLVRGLAARRLSLLLSPSLPMPSWASGCKRHKRVCRPDAAEYGRFLRALGRRYSGAYRDENQGSGVLPRVEQWSFSNEPNQPAWLRPQFARRDGRVYPFAAVRYRSMVLAGTAALRATGHGGDELLLGETGPIGRVTGPLATRPVSPRPFLRTLLCLDGRKGPAAAIRGCTSPRRLRVTGYAHHPYTRGGSQPPRTKGKKATEITIASIGRLEKLLDAAAKKRRLPKDLPIHYTEYGFQTDPPDGLFGVPLARQAEFLNESDWMAFRNPRVRTVAQYKLADDRSVSGFQSGLRFRDFEAKPSYDAYRLGIWVRRRGETRLRFWGQVRPPAAGDVSRVEIQNAPFGSSDFRTVATIDVVARNGTFVRTLPRREGRFRLRWGSVLSREASIAGR